MDPTKTEVKVVVTRPKRHPYRLDSPKIPKNSEDK